MLWPVSKEFQIKPNVSKATAIVFQTAVFLLHLAAAFVSEVWFLMMAQNTPIREVTLGPYAILFKILPVELMV
jgi:hypothetical protein